jgi:APA family basic amino acid/polyamine antiporter
MMGIGAIIGTGIFVLTGTAAAGGEGHPAAGAGLILSFVITGVACGLAALCYAEFASMIPIAGSAYTYAYASFGELFAWIIGWDLVLEYAVGNIAVAIGWSGYFKNLIEYFGIHIPLWLSIDPATAAAQGAATLDKLPHIGSVPLCINLPAVIIVGLVTWLLVIGVQESARVNSAMVILKLCLIALFIFVGVQHINTAFWGVGDPATTPNWQPFAPNGFKGIMTGAALIFFAYVGFDAVSTAAEESVNPQRDLPRGMIYALLICTILYIIVSAILTGMVPLQVLATEKPVAVALNHVGAAWAGTIISLGAVLSITSVLVVMQLGQTRVFYSMSRDGLLPKIFSKIHDKYKTPVFSTIITGLFVGIPAGLMDIGEAAELTNIGTLFAFVLVAIGVWILRVQDPERERKFRVPAYQFICAFCVLICLYLMSSLPIMTWRRFFVWLQIGLNVYFIYSISHSHLGESDKIKGAGKNPMILLGYIVSTIGTVLFILNILHLLGTMWVVLLGLIGIAIGYMLKSKNNDDKVQYFGNGIFLLNVLLIVLIFTMHLVEKLKGEPINFF